MAELLFRRRSIIITQIILIKMRELFLYLITSVDAGLVKLQKNCLHFIRQMTFKLSLLQFICKSTKKLLFADNGLENNYRIVLWLICIMQRRSSAFLRIKFEFQLQMYKISSNAIWEVIIWMCQDKKFYYSFHVVPNEWRSFLIYNLNLPKHQKHWNKEIADTNIFDTSWRKLANHNELQI